MEQSPKTSFIPKQGAGAAPMRQRRSFNLLAFIATVVFLATLTFSIGVYFYKQYSETSLEAKKKELADLQSSFEKEDIGSIRMLEKQLNTAKALLDQHLSLTKVFDALEDGTQKKTELESFSFNRLNSGGAEISLEGNAASFNTAALQKRAFAGEKAFKEDSVLFSGLNKTIGEDGTEIITFNVKAQLDTKETAYTVDKASSTPITVIAATSTATTTPEISGDNGDAVDDEVQ